MTYNPTVEEYEKKLSWANKEDLDQLGKMYDEDLKKGWVYKSINYSGDKYLIVPNFMERGNDTFIMYELDSFTQVGYVYPTENLYKAIKNWELKHSLNPETVKTLEDLINEL
jgi:hypothetical protein